MKIPGTDLTVPPWALAASGGVLIGGIALRTLSNRQGEPADTGGELTTDGEYATYGAYGGSPGIVVPPIYNQPSSDPGYGPVDLLDTYMGGLQDLLSFQQTASMGIAGEYSQLVEDIGTGYQPLVSGWGQLAAAQQLGIGQAYGQVQHVSGLLTGGGATATPAPAGTVAVPAAPSAPVPASPRVEYENRTRDNGKTGAARRVWCNRVKIHRYPDGRTVVVSETKVKEGAC